MHHASWQSKVSQGRQSLEFRFTAFQHFCQVLKPEIHHFEKACGAQVGPASTTTMTERNSLKDLSIKGVMTLNILFLEMK